MVGSDDPSEKRIVLKKWAFMGYAIENRLVMSHNL